MKFNFRILAFLAFAFWLGTQSTQAQGNYNLQAAVHGSGSGNGTLPYTATYIGPTPGMVDGFGFGDGNGNQTASATAAVHDNGSTDPFASGSSIVFSDRAGSFVPTAEGNVGFIYGDAVFLTGPNDLPASIRLHFQATGNLETSPVGASSGVAFSSASCFARGTNHSGFFGGIGIETLAESGNPSFSSEIAFLELRTKWSDFENMIQTTDTAHDSWDNISFSSVDGTFTGTFHFDVTLDSALNGYDFEMYLGSSANAQDSSAATVCSFNMQNVTDINDIPLDFELTFASGRILSNTLVGDVNLDGVINLLDVAPFIDAISTGIFQPEADVNLDGVVNLLDVDPFIMLLSSQ